MLLFSHSSIGQVKSLEKRAGDLVRGSMARFRGMASV